MFIRLSTEVSPTVFPFIYKQEINERYKVQKFITYYNKWDIMMLNTLLQQLGDCAT